MRAYHNDPAIKTTILAQLQAHHDADEIIKGVYWQEGKGCAIGCTIHGSDYALYEELFGIPEMLARLEDLIFEGLPNAESKLWPLRFMRSIAPGADLTLVGWKFLAWLLKNGLPPEAVNARADVQQAVKRSAALMERLASGEAVSCEEAAAQATLAVQVAKAAQAAQAIQAAEAARAAAQVTAPATRRATLAAALAAETWAARENAYSRQADRLCELLTAAYPLFLGGR